MKKNLIRLSEEAKKNYEYWKKVDRKKYNRINLLLLSIKESPSNGIGKPEALKYDLTGFWSRRIDSKNRIIYEVKKERRK